MFIINGDYCFVVMVFLEFKWSRWSSWSDCTKTCGTGTRYRSRKCVAIKQRAVQTPVCAGKPKQILSCAEWRCPGKH